MATWLQVPASMPSPASPTLRARILSAKCLFSTSGWAGALPVITPASSLDGNAVSDLEIRSIWLPFDEKLPKIPASWGTLIQPSAAGVTTNSPGPGVGLLTQYFLLDPKRGCQCPIIVGAIWAGRTGCQGPTNVPSGFVGANSNRYSIGAPPSFSGSTPFSRSDATGLSMKPSA